MTSVSFATIIGKNLSGQFLSLFTELQQSLSHRFVLRKCLIVIEKLTVYFTAT